MKISDLDLETKRVMFAAHVVAKDPTEANLERLRRAVAAFDEKHADERWENIIRALWGPDGILRESER